jgi:superfamily II DNA or RNA helicase
MQAKAQKQKIALNASKDNPFLFLEWFTGLGKSKAALDIMEYHKDAKWVVVCKELNHMITWKDEADKWKVDFTDVTLISYDSLHKLPQDESLNLILDEAHALTPTRVKKLKALKINRILALTATMPWTKKSLLYSLGNFKVYSIPMSKAIEDGILPEPTIYQIKVNLSRKARASYDKILGAQRKRLLAAAKTGYVRQYLDYDKRFVCFTGSIEQCNLIGGENAIHSSKSNRVEVITKFNDLEIDHLFAVNMLRESMNLRNIEVGYIVQLDNQEKSTIQMLGRSFRSKNPTMYVFIAKKTVDERYAENAFSQIPKKFIKVIDAHVPR